MTKNPIDAFKTKRHKMTLWDIVETIAFLISGAIACICLVYVIGAVLANLGYQGPQSSAKATLISKIIYTSILLIPPITLFGSIKAIRHRLKARWAVIVALMAGLFGGTIMLLGFGIGWHYAAESGKEINHWQGIMASGVAALLSASPYAIIAIKRFLSGKKIKRLEEAARLRDEM